MRPKLKWSPGPGVRVQSVVFSDEDNGLCLLATAPVAALAKQLGFAPVKLGKFNEGGALGFISKSTVADPYHA